MTDHTTLTDAEREALIEVTEKHFMLTDLRRVPLCCNCGNWYAEGDYPWPGFRAHLAMHVRLAVERIVAARVAEARADERERIAQAIEGHAFERHELRSMSGWGDDLVYSFGIDDGVTTAARIAREGEDRRRRRRLLARQVPPDAGHVPRAVQRGPVHRGLAPQALRPDERTRGHRRNAGRGAGQARLRAVWSAWRQSMRVRRPLPRDAARPPGSRRSRDPRPLRRAEAAMTRPLIPGYIRRAAVRLVDAVCAPLDRALCRWTNETGDDA